MHSSGLCLHILFICVLGSLCPCCPFQSYIEPLQKCEHVSEDAIRDVFVNLVDILTFQAEFVDALEAAFANEGDDVACQRVFLQHVRGLQRLYGLLDHPDVRSFIRACQLRSQSKLNLEAYLLSVMQRICKYPLLFKELLKRSSTDTQRQVTQQAYEAMAHVAHVVNEDKRRFERLEAIDAWQNQVEGWTGPNLRDTSTQLLFCGTLLKFSISHGKSAHSDLRTFFLFDNELIYCKGVPAAVAKENPIIPVEDALKDAAGLVFKGRISTQNMSLLDLDDGRAHVQTSGQAVQNAFKVSNVSKGKWYVLQADSTAVKQQWLEALHAEVERIAQSQEGKMASFDDHSELSGRLLAAVRAAEPRVIRDHKTMLTSLRNVFYGQDLVRWLLAQRWDGLDTEESAVVYGQTLVDVGIIHHAHDRAGFENGKLLYRFRQDDGTFDDHASSHDTVNKDEHVFKDKSLFYRFSADDAVSNPICQGSRVSTISRVGQPIAGAQSGNDPVNGDDLSEGTLGEVAEAIKNTPSRLELTVEHAGLFARRDEELSAMARYVYTSSSSRQLTVIESLQRSAHGLRAAEAFARVLIQEDEMLLETLLDTASTNLVAGDFVKRSADKDSRNRALEAINLHTYIIEVFGDTRGVAAHAWTTVGAFAAHHLGFRNTASGWKNRLIEVALSEGDELEMHEDTAMHGTNELIWVRNVTQNAEGYAPVRLIMRTGALTSTQVDAAVEQAEAIKANAAAIVRILQGVAWEIAFPEAKLRHLAVTALRVAVASAKLQAGGDMADVNAAAAATVAAARACVVQLCMQAAVLGVLDQESNAYLNWDIQEGSEHRLDSIRSAALSALTSGFCEKLQLSIEHGDRNAGASLQWLNDVALHGVLAIFTSLLSTGGTELGYKIGLLGSRRHLVVEITVDPTTWQLLPPELQHAYIPVCAVLFNQGINQVQTEVLKVGGDQLQNEINAASWQLLEQHADAVRSHLTEQAGEHNTLYYRHKEERIRELQTRIAAAVTRSGIKNSALLHLVAELGDLLHGLQFISCKSAKDRTAMFATAQAAETLVRHHGMPFNQLRVSLDVTRQSGVRRSNVTFNTGKNVFAFNDDQVKVSSTTCRGTCSRQHPILLHAVCVVFDSQNHLPLLLRPPPGSYGKNMT
ncbi:uncharacterized protein MONBRDRAFT_23984 [Monosiga brevicollis MX1]|uniref:Uncharacterized protein n=1 Tax=Monosiga brevicollis TaxID=81824 RepID=A9UUC7_MONBE|nr:uncharacterized protein MONBRDRAFT_23984 [Monosiga brevicollis MX1]EDQ91073.1 predicted protein [Monosiga brevicollis MX1]|eukprot:XP_001744370.1 hypothetical protein [Monosiga brevicollis MX1]